MITKKAGFPVKCNHCGEDVEPDLHSIDLKVDNDPQSWAWVCGGCGTRINQTMLNGRTATEVVKPGIRKWR